MPNAKDLRTSSKKIIAIGPTGTGKTKQFLTLPGTKKMFITDPGALETIQGHDVEYECFFRDAVAGIWKSQKGKSDPRRKKKTEPLAYNQFEEAVEKEMETEFSEFQNYAFDSLTTLSTILLDRLLFINGRWGSVPELGDYNLLGITLNNIFNTILPMSSSTFYLIGHDDTVQDDVTKKIVTQFDITKNIRRLLPRLCTDVWYFEVENTPSGSKYMIQTGSDRRGFNAAKNSFGLNFREDVTIDPKKPVEGQGIGRFFK